MDQFILAMSNEDDTCYEVTDNELTYYLTYEGIEQGEYQGYRIFRLDVTGGITRHCGTWCIPFMRAGYMCLRIDAAPDAGGNRSYAPRILHSNPIQFSWVREENHHGGGSLIRMQTGDSVWIKIHGYSRLATRRRRVCYQTLPLPASLVRVMTSYVYPK